MRFLADIDAVKTALEGDDDSAVESAVEKLQGSMGKIGEAVYSQDGAEGAAAGEQPAQDEDEDIVDAVAMLWLTGTFRSSIRLYSEPEATWLSEEDGETGAADETAGWGEPGAGDAGSDASDEDWGGWAPARIEVPTAIALFPQDLMQPPRELCERFFTVERFTVHDQGGHWAALEAPDDVAGDLLAFAADKG